MGAYVECELAGDNPNNDACAFESPPCLPCPPPPPPPPVRSLAFNQTLARVTAGERVWRTKMGDTGILKTIRYIDIFNLISFRIDTYRYNTGRLTLLLTVVDTERRAWAGSFASQRPRRAHLRATQPFLFPPDPPLEVFFFFSAWFPGVTGRLRGRRHLVRGSGTCAGSGGSSANVAGLRVGGRRVSLRQDGGEDPGGSVRGAGGVRASLAGRAVLVRTRSYAALATHHARRRCSRICASSYRKRPNSGARVGVLTTRVFVSSPLCVRRWTGPHRIRAFMPRRLWLSATMRRAALSAWIPTTLKPFARCAMPRRIEMWLAPRRRRVLAQNHGRFAADTTREHVNFRIALTGTCAMFVGELIGPSTAIRPVASATTRKKASVAGSRVAFVEAAIGSARPCRAAGVRSNCVGCVTFFVSGLLLV